MAPVRFCEEPRGAVVEQVGGGRVVLFGKPGVGEQVPRDRVFVELEPGTRGSDGCGEAVDGVLVPELVVLRVVNLCGHSGGPRADAELLDSRAGMHEQHGSCPRPSERQQFGRRSASREASVDQV